MAALDGPFLTALIFSLKTFAAALLALSIAFWLGLDEPYWALLTVFVVAQVDSGLVLAKSFYRMLGTVAGVLMTVALVFAFAQYGELFIASLAVWIGLCSFAARAARNFASYSFQLAGYTVAIVGIPAALNPGGAYPRILARFTEVSLGIACMALVSRLIFPAELAPKLVALVRELMRRADFAETAMDPAADREQLAAERAGLAKDFATVEAMRSSAFFESADARLLNEPLRRVTYAAVDLCAVAAAAAARLGRAAHVTSPQDSGPSIANSNDTPRENAEVVSVLLRVADRQAVARAHMRLAEAGAALDRGKSLAGPRATGGLWSDPVPAALNGIRAALAVAITTAFWFATAWPSGPIAVIVAGVVCILFASLEQPEKITLAAAATILVAAVPVFVTQFYLLPYASDFVSMAGVLAPLLLLCGFIIAQPGIGPLGLLAAVYLAVSSHIDNNNVATYD
ncbi:MAG: FUSC family protein, partial [Rhodoplanes sp.]